MAFRPYNKRAKPDGTPDHRPEIYYLLAHAKSPWLSPLEVSAILTAIEMLRGHEDGSYEICTNPYSLALVSLALGAPFEVFHDVGQDIRSASTSWPDLFSELDDPEEPA